MLIITAWRQLDSGTFLTKWAELNNLLISRARVCVDLKRFVPVVANLDEALASMTANRKRADRRVAYLKFADTYAQQGLSHKRLAGQSEQRPAGSSAKAEWIWAIMDYNEALSL